MSRRTRTLGQKLLEMTSEIPPLPKTGVNPDSGYSYLEEEKLIRAIRDSLIAKGILFLTSVRSAKREGLMTEVETSHLFQDAKTGERRVVRSIGQALNTSDAGAPIAITAARKQALRRAFLVVTREPQHSDVQASLEQIPSAPVSKRRRGVRTLAQKILDASAALSPVLKTGLNDEQGFTYVESEEVLAHARKVLVDQGILLLTPSVKTKREGTMTEVWTRYSFSDASNRKKSFGIRWYDQGRDQGDKGAAKALTSAEKHMLLSTLLIPTQEDPEKQALAEAGPPRSETLSRESKLRRIDDLVRGLDMNIDRDFLEQHNLPTTFDKFSDEDLTKLLKLVRSMAGIKSPE